MTRGKQLLMVTLLLLAAGQVVLADGMIVPVRPDIRVRGSWAVTYHHVNIKVRDQVASVTIDQEFVNTGSGMIEVEYFFPVPPNAAIDAMTLMVDGKEFTAKLLKADEARKIYEEIVRRKKDPALLEYAGFGLIKTSAFPLEPNKPVRVVVNYKDTCRKDQDTVEVWYPLNTEKFSARRIEDVEVRVDIKSKADIGEPYSPTHDITVDRKSARHVVVTYHEKKVLPVTDFQVFYRESNRDVGATFLTHHPVADKDGYFMLLVSPNPRTGDEKIVPKDVVLVLDRSGSMSGKKIVQAKEALEYILRNLNPRDRFTVVSYSDNVKVFSDQLTPVSDKDIEDASDWVDRIEAAGGTNIHEALQTAMKMCNGRVAGQVRPAYVIFLTDGLPTAGETKEQKIIEDTTDANTNRARLFAFGVGYDVNIRLLDRLVRENNGRSDYVKPNEPVESKVSSLYRKIKNPVMTDLKVRVEHIPLHDMYPRQLGDLFEGDRIVLVGRYDRQHTKNIELFFRGGGSIAGGYTSTLVLTGMYQDKQRGFEYSVTIEPPGKDGRYPFVEKLWAIRRVGYLLDEIQLHGESKELVDELVRLSKDYGIMTPYTSFLADETTALHSPAEMREGARLGLGDLKRVRGAAGQRHAMNRQAFALAAKPLARSRRGATRMFGFSKKDTYEAGTAEAVANVVQVGNQAVYRRQNVWIASNATDVDLTRDKDKIKVIERFSKEYFELVRANTTEENQFFATQQEGQELVIRLRGQTYRIR